MYVLFCILFIFFKNFILKVNFASKYIFNPKGDMIKETNIKQQNAL